MKIFNYENVDKMAAQSADQSEHSEDFGRVWCLFQVLLVNLEIN